MHSDSKASVEELADVLAGFDDYSRQFVGAVDANWNASTRMRSVEYCVFLYGAAIAVVRGYGYEDEYSVAILGPYFSRFMDWQLSMPWLLQCETELSKSPRLRGVQAAGANTAQAVLLAASQRRSEDLSRPHNMELLILIFSELRKLMAEKAATDEPLFGASGKLYESVVSK